MELTLPRFTKLLWKITITTLKRGIRGLPPDQNQQRISLKFIHKKLLQHHHLLVPGQCREVGQLGILLNSTLESWNQNKMIQLNQQDQQESTTCLRLLTKMPYAKRTMTLGPIPAKQNGPCLNLTQAIV